MRLPLLAALAGTALLCACDGGTSHGETYALPTAQVRETLLDTDAPIQVLGTQAVDWKTSALGDGTVLWTVLGERGGQLIRFSAKLVPVDGGTRVDVDVLPPEGKMQERVAKGIAENPSIRDLYHVAMTEEIDAKLENRGFDASRIAAATIRAATANMASIGDSMDKAGAEFRKRDEENMARAYRDERRNVTFGTYGNDGAGPKRFGAPMDNPNVK
jgi:hypothetical protein